MRGRMKRTLGIVLALVMVFTGIPTFFNAPSARAEGTPTDSSYFIFDAETGTIEGYVDKEGPVDLVVPSQIDGVEVKEIGDGAFKYSTSSWSTNLNTPLESLVLPGTVTKIGKDAFSTNNLRSLDLPEGLTTIGNRAFERNKLTSVNLPDSLSRLEGRAFQLNGIEKIDFPAGLTELNKGTWSDQDNGIFFRNFKDFETEDLRFTVIEDASGKATNLNTRGIVNPVKVNLKFIDAESNADILPARSVVGKNVQAIEKVGHGAKIIPGDGEHIENYDNPFKGLTILYNRADYFEEIANNYYVRNKEVTIEAPAKPGYLPVDKKISKTFTEAEEDLTFKYNKSDENFQLTVNGDNVTTNPAPGEVLAGTEVEVNVDVPTGFVLTELKVNGENIMTYGEEQEAFSSKFVITEDTTVEPTFLEKSPFIFDKETGTITGYETSDAPVELTIPDKIYGVTVKHIGDDAFYYSKYGGRIANPITKLSLPDTIESFGLRAFCNSEIEEITIPRNLTKVGDRAFYGNKKLKKVVFPEGSRLTELEERCFEYAPIEEINLPEGLEKIGASALAGNNLNTIEIPSTVKEIQNMAFENSTIENIVLPAGIEKLGLDNAGESRFGILYNTFPDKERENYRFATVTDTSGRATIDNTFAIVNPTKVKFRFVNAANMNDIQDPIEAVGIEKKKLQVSENNVDLVAGSGDFLTNYEVDHKKSAVYRDFLDDILKGNYFYAGKEESFETPDMAGYTKATENVGLTLAAGSNEVIFKYNEEPPVNLSVEGEGLNTSPAVGELEKGEIVEVTLVEPANKQLAEFKVNGVDKKAEMDFNGVRYKYKFQITEDTNLQAVYEDADYAEEFEVTWDKTNLKLGDKAKLVVKYRDTELDQAAYTVEAPAVKFELDEEGQFQPLESGEYLVTVKLKDNPELASEEVFTISSVTVSVRLEDEYATVLKPTDVVVDKLYVEEGVDYWKNYTFDKPVAALAIVKACQENDIAQVTDKEDFDLSGDLNWMKVIGADQFSYTEDMGSFMYDVNTDFVSFGVGQQEIQEGDVIRIYYVTSWANTNPALYFTEELYEVYEGDSIEFKLNAYYSLPPDYMQVYRGPYQGAHLEINPEGEGLYADISEEVSDAEGKVSYKFNEVGEYHVSAVNPEEPVVRPYAKVIVSEKPANMQTVFTDDAKGVRVELTEAIDANRYKLVVEDADDDLSEYASAKALDIYFASIKTNERIALADLAGEEAEAAVRLTLPDDFKARKRLHKVMHKRDGEFVRLKNTKPEDGEYNFTAKSLGVYAMVERNEVYKHVSVNDVHALEKKQLKQPSEYFNYSRLRLHSWNTDKVTVTKDGVIYGREAGVTRVRARCSGRTTEYVFDYFIRVYPGRAYNMKAERKGKQVQISATLPKGREGLRLYRAKRDSKGKYNYEKYRQAFKHTKRQWSARFLQPEGGRYGYYARVFRVMPLYKRDSTGHFHQYKVKRFYGHKPKKYVYYTR